MLQNEVLGAWQSNPLVVDGDHVRDAASQRRDGRGCRDRARVLAVPAHAVVGGPRVLRRQQPRRGHPRRHAVHGHAGRTAHRDRCQERPPDLERRGRRREAGLLGHDGAAHREGQGHRRRGRRGVRHPRLSSPRTTRRQARASGASTPCRDPGSLATTRGAASPGSTAAHRSGSPGPTIRISTSPTGASATPAPTGIPISAGATTSTRTRSSRWTPTPARSAGTSSSRPTTPTTTTRCRCRCWST